MYIPYDIFVKKQEDKNNKNKNAVNKVILKNPSFYECLDSDGKFSNDIYEKKYNKQKSNIQEQP